MLNISMPAPAMNVTAMSVTRCGSTPRTKIGMPISEQPSMP